MASQKERLSKDSHCSKCQDQRNTRFKVTDEKVHDGRKFVQID